MSKISLESYFKKALKNNIIDFHIRITPDSFKSMHFYIHPQGVSGDTADFLIRDNNLFNTGYQKVKKEEDAA